MKRIRSLVALLVTLHFFVPVLRAETSMDVLNDELRQAQEQHEDATSKQFSDFITALDTALQSPDAALQLYQNAGGDMPDPAPVITTHDTETPDEKALREAQDQAVDAALASVIQLHCGVMRFAAYFIQNPDQKGLQAAWIVWLKQAAQAYPQAGNTPPDTRVRPPAPDEQKEHNRGANAGDQNPPPKPKKKYVPPDYAKMLKGKAVRDSVISAYLGYNAWDDKDQGNWRVCDIPRFYREEILDPLRVNPNAATLAAWDVYIAMKNADEPDPDKWTAVDYPALLFERSCDAFYAGPSDEKLEALVALIKNNPTYPDLDAWIARVKQMLQEYRTYKSTGILPRPSDNSTNAAPAAPAAPAASAPASTTSTAPSSPPTPAPAGA